MDKKEAVAAAVREEIKRRMSTQQPEKQQEKPA